MRLLIPASLIVILVLVVGLYFLARPKPARAADPNVYEGLRGEALRFSPSDLGIHLPDDNLSAYGVVMDIGMGNNTATVTSFSSGDASLYLSTGGGVIGGIGHDAVRQAARAWVKTAQEHLSLFAPTTSFPHPADGHVRFFVLTNRGALTADVSEERLKDGSDEQLLPMWGAGQNVITAIRLSTHQPPD